MSSEENVKFVEIMNKAKSGLVGNRLYAMGSECRDLVNGFSETDLVWGISDLIGDFNKPLKRSEEFVKDISESDVPWGSLVCLMASRNVGFRRIFEAIERVYGGDE